MNPIKLNLTFKDNNKFAVIEQRRIDIAKRVGEEDGELQFECQSSAEVVTFKLKDRKSVPGAGACLCMRPDLLSFKV